MPSIHVRSVAWAGDQIIRGLYEPFIAEWHAAFAADSIVGEGVNDGKASSARRRSSLLVLRVEDMLDKPAQTRDKLQAFLGFGSSSGGSDGNSNSNSSSGSSESSGPPMTRSYAASHAASLNVSCCGGGRGPPEPMLARRAKAP